MITDEQGREWLLQKLYDDGWRYIVGGDGTYVYITKDKPFILGGMYRANGSKYRCIEVINGTLPSLETCDVMNIAEVLGIVDWSKVAVDTPIFVRDSINEVWKCRYFAEYKDGKVYTWRDGKTSWSNVISDRPVVWGYAELAFKE
nr:MAG TPA: hypothetical protein [Caudoviricetes sp.]